MNGFVTKDDVAKVIGALTALTKQEVLVGIPAASAGRDDGSPINNAELGYLLNFGGTISQPARVQTVYRKVNSDGSFSKGGRFVKRKVSNYATEHQVEAHEVVIPARPWLEPGINAGAKKIVEAMQQGATAALSGNIAGADQGLTAAGIAAQNAVRAFINAGNFEALAPSTLAARRSRGHASEKPLVETGGLRNSVTYVKRKR